MCVVSMVLCACHKYKGGPSYITLVNNSDRSITFQDFLYSDIQADSILVCHGPAFCLEADSFFKLPHLGWDLGYKNAGWLV